MANDKSCRWYQLSLLEIAVAVSILLIIVALVLAEIVPQGSSHVETRTTDARALTWIEAANEFERQNQRSLESVEELEKFVFSDACEFCYLSDLKFDWWGTPFRIWIDESESATRKLTVQSTRWNREFDDADRTWTRTLPDTPAHDATQ
jgi:hypothetical protein